MPLCLTKASEKVQVRTGDSGERRQWNALRSFQSKSKSFSNNVAVTGHMGRERKQVPWRGSHPSLGKALGCEKTTVQALQGRLWFLG